MQSSDYRGHGRRVSALVYALVDQRIQDREFLNPNISTNAIVQFVLEQQSRMPDYLRFPIKFATWLHAIDAFKNHFNLYVKLSVPQRQSQLQLWRNSPIAPFRDFIKLYESLVTLGFESIAIGDPIPIETVIPSFQPSISMEYPHPFIASHASNRLKTDIAVIGSGPGGSITSTLLAEAGRNVTLIEEGGHYPLESCKPFSAQEMIQKYRGGGLTPAMGKPKVAYVEGQCVGGGSEINSGLYHRTPPEILERWRNEYLVDQLREEDLIPHFLANEHDLTVAKTPGKTPSNSLKLHEGATDLGWNSQEVPRWFAFDGNVDSSGVPTGHRQSMTKTFIPRFENAGGQLLSRTKVQKFRRVGDHWEIQSSDSQGQPITIETSHLFVSCGATQTPALLQRSGLGRKPGSTLFMHPTVKFVARFRDEINSDTPSVGVHQVKHFSPRLSFGCSIGTKPYLSLGMLDSNHHPQYVDDHWRHMSIYYSMITGTGRGSVRVLPGFRDPLVQYKLSQSDMSDLADGLRKMASILFQSGAVELQSSISSAPPIRSMNDISQIPNVLSRTFTNLMTIHLFSSCPMGENKTKCVANSFGAVHGLKNLYLADASLLCTAPGVNPQGSIMAIVRRNAIEWLDKNP